MTVYVYTLARKWIWHEDDSISTVVRYDNADNWDVLQQNETNLVPSFMITDIRTLKFLKIQDIEKYLSITYKLATTDFENGKPTFGLKDLGVR